MNPPEVNDYDYIKFLIAAQKAYSCMEAGRVQPESGKLPAHDAIARLLHVAPGVILRSQLSTRLLALCRNRSTEEMHNLVIGLFINRYEFGLSV